MADVKLLPQEIITWIINVENDFEAEDSDGEDCTDLRMITILDSRRVVITYNVKSPEKTGIKDHMKQALRGAMCQPFSGKPRRPSHISFQNSHPLSEDELKKLGLKLEPREIKCCGFTEDSLEILRACNLCRRRGDSKLFQTCPNCLAVFYCSDECFSKDRCHPLDVHGHDAWCARMKSYLEDAPNLAQFPFKYTEETTRPDFGLERYESFLRCHEVYGQGLWYRELPDLCYQHSPKYGELKDQHCQYVLKEESQILSQRITNDLSSPIASWEDYYRWRGLKMDSPIAILLSMSLTTYHIVSTLLYKHYPTLENLSEKSRISFHIIGAEREADYSSTFEELCSLMPNMHFDITIIGPEISSQVDGDRVVKENLNITIRKGLYHQMETLKPDVVIGFNAGLAAYASWVETLHKLKEQKVPAFFTDYCRYSCECSKGPVEGLHFGSVSNITINPFRSPIRRYCEEHRLPWYSSGFIFSIQYND